MLKIACENLSKLEQEERHFAEMERLNDTEGGWSDAKRLKAEQSLVKRWRAYQLDAVRYSWIPISRREVVDYCVSAGDKSAEMNADSADTMEQLLRESQIRMGISQEGSKGEYKGTLMDVLNVDKPVQFVHVAALDIPNQNERNPNENT